MFFVCLRDVGRGCVVVFFFFNDTATTEIYTLSLHDALPIWLIKQLMYSQISLLACYEIWPWASFASNSCRSEEHTSELQSRQYLVCRLLLEKKKKQHTSRPYRLLHKVSVKSFSAIATISTGA